MLRLENISKSYLQRGLVLDKLDLQVNKGESLAITGPSGSGKTTLLNIIGLMDHPDSGDVVFNGSSILSYGPDESARYRNRNIGFVFQDHLLLAHLNIMENILLPLLASGNPENDFNEKAAYASALMEKTGIASLVDKFPFQISGGEAQRATLVRALVNKPSLLLADEPTGSLDSNNADLLGNLLRDLNEELGVTLIVVTHSSDLASMMKLNLRLSDGRLVK
jgi:ABC-type lipoprotein export system ATPase subunit